MKINKVFLLLTLTLLLLGITYATDDTIIGDDDVVSEIESTDLNPEIVEDKIVREEAIDNKEINKQNMENRTSKTASQTLNVYNFNTLHNSLTSGAYNTVTLNIKSDIKLTSNTTVNSKITHLTINGNGKTIDGVKKYSFLNITTGTVTINNIKIINCNGEYGGAISKNRGNLIISNSTLQNNKADKGGAIYNYQGTLTITNTTLQNNNANQFGGAIDNYGTLTITNSTLQYNNAGIGGAIDNYNAIITIANTTLQYNYADYDGGAICNGWQGIITIANSRIQYNYADYDGGAISNGLYCIITITNTTLQNNNANQFGGAIYNDEGNLTISKSTLQNNNATEMGGAIYNGYGNLTITNSTLQDNKAEEGGAIYTIESSEINIENNYFENNSAKVGAAILTISNAFINNNKFKANLAKDLVPPAINDHGEDNLIRNNQNEKISKYYSTICLDYYGYNNTITNNIFEKDTVNITINPINTVTYGKNLIIKGSLTDNINNKVINTWVQVTINNYTRSVKSDSKGLFTLTTTKYVAGLNNVRVSYAGNAFYAPSKTTSSFNVNKLGTTINIGPIANTYFGSKVTIKGNLTNNNGNLIKNTQLNAKVNGKTFSLKTDKTGKFVITAKSSFVGKGNVTISYAGSSIYKSGKASATYTVSTKATKIIVNKINNTYYGDKVKITGTFMDVNGVKFKNTRLNASLNGKTFAVKTNDKGEYTITTKAKTPGTYNIRVFFAGNAYYGSASTKSTFTVTATTTKITINKIANVKYKDKAVITGTFRDKNNNNIKTTLNVNLNGKTFNVVTDTNGKFKITSAATTLGTNNITISYPGNKYFKTTTSKATYKVTN